MKNLTLMEGLAIAKKLGFDFVSVDNSGFQLYMHRKPIAIDDEFVATGEKKDVKPEYDNRGCWVIEGGEDNSVLLGGCTEAWYAFGLAYPPYGENETEKENALRCDKSKLFDCSSSLKEVEYE